VLLAGAGLLLKSFAAWSKSIPDFAPIACHDAGQFAPEYNTAPMMAQFYRQRANGSRSYRE